MSQLAVKKDDVSLSARRPQPDLLEVFAHEWFIVFFGMRYGLGPLGRYDANAKVSVHQFVERKFSCNAELAMEQIEMAGKTEILSGSAIIASSRGNKSIVQISLSRLQQRMVRAGGSPPECQLYGELLRAKTARRVRSIFNRSRWLQDSTKPFLKAMFDHAGQLAIALASQRFPKSSRPSSEAKQMAFLACAMASISCGFKTCSAGVNRLRKLRFEPPNLG